jgi:hypothetical protein
MISRVLHALGRATLSLPARDRRAITLGVAIVAPSMVYALGVSPLLRALERERAAAAVEHAAYERERTLVARVGEIMAERKQRTAWLSEEAKRLFHRSTDIAATGALTTYVAAVADEVGIALRSTETRRPVSMDSLIVLQLGVRAEGASTLLLAFLDALENGDHLVRVDRLVLAHDAVATASAGDGVPQLSAQMEIYGYALAPGARTPANSPASGAAYVSLDGASGDTVIESERDPFALALPDGSDVDVDTPRPVQLVGTVLGHSRGSFAICVVDGGPPTVVRLGDRFAGYTLRAVHRGRATFVAPGGQTVFLQIPVPAA